MTKPNYRKLFAGLALFVLAATLLTGCGTSSRLNSTPPTSELALLVVGDQVVEIQDLYVGQAKEAKLSDGTVLEVRSDRPYVATVTTIKNGAQQSVIEGSWRKLKRIPVAVDVYVFEPQGLNYADLEQKMKKADIYLASRRAS